MQGSRISAGCHNGTRIEEIKKNNGDLELTISERNTRNSNSKREIQSADASLLAARVKEGGATRKNEEKDHGFR
jgi:hypothetical protein